MSCKYCEKYPEVSTAAGAIRGDDSYFYIEAENEPLLCADEYIDIWTYDPNRRYETTSIGTPIRYCPWCGRDLLGSDETEPDKEPDECEEPDEEPDETATPDYYTAHGVEAIDVIEAVCNRAQLAPDDVFCLGNVLKYALRAGRKGGTEADFESDCAKAANYAHRMVADGWLDQDGGAA